MYRPLVVLALGLGLAGVTNAEPPKRFDACHSHPVGDIYGITTPIASIS
jgi:hypothetical protein